MTIHLANLSGSLLVYLLVFSRVGAMVMLLPGIGEAGVPSRVRLALALAISFAMAPIVSATYGNHAPQSVFELGMLIGKEVTAGALIGGMSRIIMGALSTAGYLVANQTGLGYAQTVDPEMGEQGAIVGNFFTVMGAALIFATNLHHLAIGAIQGSYSLLPPGAALPTDDLAELAIRMTAGSFALGLQLAAPFLVFGFAVNAAIGLLARLMPQFQVFFVAMPINILAGFFLMMLLIGSMMTIFLNYYASQMAHFLS